MTADSILAELTADRRLAARRHRAAVCRFNAAAVLDRLADELESRVADRDDDDDSDELAYANG